MSARLRFAIGRGSQRTLTPANWRLFIEPSASELPRSVRKPKWKEGWPHEA
jgi:hypothetical protein